MADNFNDLKDAIEFDSTYGAGAGQSTKTVYGAPASNLQQLVTQTLQGVLGRSFKPDDPESFKAALNSSFETQQVSGKNVLKHIPRAYPAIGATDVGAGISGAQYSLVTFAKALHEQTRPLLKNLHSLNTSVDQQDLEAAKAIFTTTWDELIAELSREGGPRLSRANDLTASILSEDGKSGYLVNLGEQLGAITRKADRSVDLDRSKVVTIEEEGHLTNFIALADYYRAVEQAWRTYRDTFLGKDLGSSLLVLERALAVVEDGVNQVFMAMDSVNVTQTERLIITIGLDPDKNLTVEDLLSWISSFASREAPSLIRDGGRRGVEAIIPTTQKLEQLTGQFISLIRPAEAQQATGDGAAADGDTGPPKLPDQFNHARVVHPLRELRRYLAELLKQAKAIAPPPEPNTPASGTGTSTTGTGTSTTGTGTTTTATGTTTTDTGTTTTDTATTQSESSSSSGSSSKKTK